MYDVERAQQLRGRSLSRVGMGQLISASLRAGKRIFSPGPAAAAGAAAAAAGAAYQGAKRTRSVFNLPGPRFNPGGAGGYVVKSGKKKRRKKNNRVSKTVERYVSKRLEKHDEGTFEPVADIRSQQGFAVFTADAFPILNDPDGTPAASALAGNKVGWFIYDLLTQGGGASEATSYKVTNVQSLANEAYRSDSFVTDNVSVMHRVPQVQDWMTQQVNKFEFSYEITMKNNSNLPSQVDVYMVVLSEASDLDPLAELQFRYDKAYNLDSAAGIKGGLDPQTVQNSHWQYFATSGMKDSDFTKWKVKKHTKAVLNGGDMANFSWQHTLRWVYEQSTNQSKYPKGSSAILFRIQGQVTHNTSADYVVGMGSAQADVHVYRRIKYHQKAPHYNGVRRISTNPTEMVIVPASQSLAADVTPQTGSV